MLKKPKIHLPDWVREFLGLCLGIGCLVLIACACLAELIAAGIVAGLNKIFHTQIPEPNWMEPWIE